MPAVPPFSAAHRRPAECDVLADKHPAACRLENLRGLVKEVEAELGGLEGRIGGSQAHDPRERAGGTLAEREPPTIAADGGRASVSGATAPNWQTSSTGLTRNRTIPTDPARVGRGGIPLRSDEGRGERLERSAFGGWAPPPGIDRWVDSLQVRKATLDAQVAEAAVSSDAISRRVEDARRELNDLREELKAKQRRIDDLRKELEDAARLKQEEQGLLERVAEQRRQASVLSDRIEGRLEAEKTRLETQVAVLNQRMATSRRQVEEDEETLGRLRSELQVKQGTLDDVRREHRAAQCRGDRADPVPRGAEQDGRAGQEPASRGPGRGRGGRPEPPPGTFAVGPLRGAIREDQDGDEMKCLEAAQACLEGYGLRFNDRVLRAFHTSLKVADVSPLVVLAGISGTGKSESPRRYAEAMGFQFLNIAVQPRWDSPQDMFGFYNYLEGRYRATELARALVQMDPFPNEEGRGWVRHRAAPGTAFETSC